MLEQQSGGSRPQGEGLALFFYLLFGFAFVVLRLILVWLLMGSL